MNRRVAALRARTAAIYRTKEVPHTLPIFSRSRVIVDHHNIMSIDQTVRPVACTQCASRTAVLACAHGASVRRTAVLACAQCASRTEAPSNGLRKYHRHERHDDPQSRGLLKFNNRFIPEHLSSLVCCSIFCLDLMISTCVCGGYQTNHQVSPTYIHTPWKHHWHCLLSKVPEQSISHFTLL